MKNQIKIYKKAMNEILECCEMRDNYGMIEDIAKDALDEATSMDQTQYQIDERDFSETPENTVRISDINKEIAKEWKKDG